MSEWKIFYTDESSLLHSDPLINGDVTLIPAVQRVNVHSVIQPFDLSRQREVIEQYHYLYSKRDDQWVGVGMDGLLDHLVNDFNNIACILNGRTATTDSFWRLRDKIRNDPDIVGGLQADEAFLTKDINKMLFGQHEDLFWMIGYEKDPSRFRHTFTDFARHRAYPEGYTEEPIYGHQTFYH